MKAYCANVVAFVAVLWTFVPTGPTSVVISDLKLFVDGQEFVIKGIGYNPVPVAMQKCNEDSEEGELYSTQIAHSGKKKNICLDW